MTSLPQFKAKLAEFGELVRTQLLGKLGKTEQALDSAKLEGLSLNDLLDICVADSYHVANEYITIAADGIKQYDLQTLMTAPVFAQHDIKSSVVVVRVKDVNASSPLYNSYVNSEALISYGINSNRYVIIANQSGASVDVYVRVDTPRI